MPGNSGLMPCRSNFALGLTKKVRDVVLNSFQHLAASMKRILKNSGWPLPLCFLACPLL